MKTVSINVMNLCVPCENRCRYCLLSYDGQTSGIDYLQSEAYARRFYTWLRANRPDLSFLFGFGYSMEHPQLLHAIDFCRSIGSATGSFLQFNGMKFREDSELYRLLSDIQSHGIKLIDLTFYGTEQYHDRFSARPGDYNLMMNTLKIANHIGLGVAVDIPLSHENVDQMDRLLSELMPHRLSRLSLFVPHSEGRGHLLGKVRFSAGDYEQLSPHAKEYFNARRFRTEQSWLKANDFPEPQKRVLTVTLRPDNIDLFERLSFEETISYLERLDDEYYQTVPPLRELALQYGNPEGDGFYSLRDLYLSYQRQYIRDHNLLLYDMNDERHCFSRRL